ncbi:hypothetical protein ABZ801_18525 [Actinomadura sp. NPDC047616]|uniref:hypothetical protein n=1 Tax=Actinomadura sp. NPDC047616 TaxID=3155914 RepID=UPI0033D2410A
MDLGLAPHTVVIVVAVALVGIVGFLLAIRQEQAERRGQQLVSAEVGSLELPEIRRLLQQNLMTPHQQFWQVMEEGLVRFRPRDRQEEIQRQRLLQEIRLRLLP